MTLWVILNTGLGWRNRNYCRASVYSLPVLTSHRGFFLPLKGDFCLCWFSPQVSALQNQIRTQTGFWGRQHNRGRREQQAGVIKVLLGVANGRRKGVQGSNWRRSQRTFLYVHRTTEWQIQGLEPAVNPSPQSIYNCSSIPPVKPHSPQSSTPIPLSHPQPPAPSPRNH